MCHKSKSVEHFVSMETVNDLVSHYTTSMDSLFYFSIKALQENLVSIMTCFNNYYSIFDKA